MTAEEMRDRIIARVFTDRNRASISDLVESCGPEAKGNLTLEFQDNLVLWCGVSDLFSEAFKLALAQIDIAVLPRILIFTEPKRLALPIAIHVRAYRTPRWLPVVLLPKGEINSSGRGAPTDQAVHMMSSVAGRLSTVD
jgi:hypothetical protein